jgi:LCP family protein required for cell wall assembly
VSGTDAGWGPPLEGRARRRRPLRALATVLLLGVAAVLALGLYVSSQVPRVAVDGLAPPAALMHVLVVGSDSREGLSAQERRELATGDASVGGGLTDTIFVMTIRGDDVALLAFPRDLFVTRCDGSVGRINAAQALGGPACLVRTVRALSGIDVQHHVTVTFEGFRDIVDAVDGVELCLEAPIADRDAGIDLPAGCQVLDGRDALGYVRVRKIDNDLRRIERQQRFLRALAGEVLQPATLLNPLRMIRLADDVGEAVTVSRGTGPLTLARLAIGSRGLARGEAITLTVPADLGTTSGGASVLYPRIAEAEEIFARFRDGSILREAIGGAIAPGDVRVEVRNGAGISGLAGEVAGLLEERGFVVVGVGNADLRDTTVIRHPRGLGPEARLLQQELPFGLGLEETDAVEVVTLVLGRDAAGR